jgi:dethiobiotin synthetase
VNRVRFVTGTDTGVGKTITSAALVVALRAAGEAPYVVKPAQTGVDEDVPDLDTVRRLAGDVPGHEGVRLRAPLAPDTAARLEGTVLPSLIDQRDAVLEASAWRGTWWTWPSASPPPVPRSRSSSSLAPGSGR